MKLFIIALLLTGCAAQQTSSIFDYMTPEEKEAWLKSYVSGIENNVGSSDRILRQIQSNQIDTQLNILNAIKH